MTASLALPLLLLGDPLRLRRVAELPYGVQYGSVLCGDLDHDDTSEFVVAWTLPGHLHWEVWKHEFLNRYRVVFADTGAYPFPPGISTGNFTPWDIGDVDGDSLTDLLGYHIYSEGGGEYHFVLGIQESPDLHTYPSSLAWWSDLYPHTTADYLRCYYTGDLDSDRRQEALWPEQYSGHLRLFENRGNNQNDLVWSDSPPTATRFAFGDFDLDGRGDFVTSDISSAGLVLLYECVGDDSFANVWRDTVWIANGSDVFAGNDVDQDGKPEFFIAFAWYGGSDAEFHLMAYETVSDNVYERHEVATVTRNTGMAWHAFSTCGDVDADSIEEIVWTTATDVYVYKATGNDQYELVWQWQNPSQCEVKTVHVKTCDLNGNGYNEVVASGILGGAGGHPEWGTCIFELETVQLLSPNGGRNLLGGETCAVRWQVFAPPRCDSVSLFLRTDTTWNMDTIATGLAPADTPYLWVVPRGPRIVEPCHVVVFAYGPGWQYDESDSAFKIITLGAAEAPAPVPLVWSLSVSPNPAHGQAQVRYSVPHRASVRVGLYDAAGRLVRDLAKSEHEPGWYVMPLSVPGEAGPGGIYFLRLEAGGWQAEQKVVLAR